MKTSFFFSALIAIPILFSCANQPEQNAAPVDSISTEVKISTVAEPDKLIADTGNTIVAAENKQVIAEEKSKTEKKEKIDPEKTEAKPAKKDDIKKVVIDSKREPPPAKGKNYRIKSFSIEGDILTLDVTYRGGCTDHDFDLYSNGMMMKSLPPQISVYLEHTFEYETCSEEIKQTIKFDISPLKKPGNEVIVLNINSADNKVEWKAE